jgi:hypothetical protein
MSYKPLEDFALITSQTYRGLLYVNLLRQRLVAQRFGEYLHLSICGDATDDLKRIDIVVMAPVNRLVSRKLVPYTSVGDLKIMIMQDFGVDGLLIWATNRAGRLLTFPIAQQYRNDVLETLFS